MLSTPIDKTLLLNCYYDRIAIDSSCQMLKGERMFLCSCKIYRNASHRMIINYFSTQILPALDVHYYATLQLKTSAQYDLHSYVHASKADTRRKISIILTLPRLSYQIIVYLFYLFIRNMDLYFEVPLIAKYCFG
jgi:hypothetical protein